MKIRGKVHLYKKLHINTDEIIPARYLNSDNEKELALHAMEDIDKNFIKKVKSGDILIGGEDFGCGSSREHAIWALRGAGIKAIIADSFARIFYRNMINNGFIAIEIKGISRQIKDQDDLEIILAKGEIVSHSQNKKYHFNPLPKFVMDIVKKKGLLNTI